MNLDFSKRFGLRLLTTAQWFLLLLQLAHILLVLVDLLLHFLFASVQFIDSTIEVGYLSFRRLQIPCKFCFLDLQLRVQVLLLS